MSEQTAIEEALTLVDRRKRNDLLLFRSAFFILIFGIFVSGSYFYFQSKANDAQNISSKLSRDLVKRDEGSELLVKVIDRKFDLFRAEIKLRNTFFGVTGGAMLGFGIGIIFTYKSRKRVNQLYENLLRELNAKNS